MRLPGNVAVGRTVEAIAPHAKLFKIAVRQPVQIGLRGQRLVEAGVKHRHLLYARKQAFGCLDAA